MAGGKIEQPGEGDQALLNSMIGNSVDVVRIPGTKRSYRIRWTKWCARRKVTEVLVNCKEGVDEMLLVHKVAACIILGGYWKIRFFFPLMWRWLAYVRQYTENQLMPVIEMGKKKVPQEEYCGCIILAIGMKDLTMTMTRAEAESARRALLSELATRAEKKDSG
jgi:hypothetical protein